MFFATTKNLEWVSGPYKHKRSARREAKRLFKMAGVRRVYILTDIGKPLDKPKKK